MGVDARAAGQVGAVIRDRSLRRVLLGFTVFRLSESAEWIAILVYAYRRGGSTQMGVAAVLLLMPAVIVAPFGAQLGDRMHRERALAMGYLIQGIAAGVTAWALAAGAPTPVVYACAAVATAAITLTRPSTWRCFPNWPSRPAN